MDSLNLIGIKDSKLGQGKYLKMLTDQLSRAGYLTNLIDINDATGVPIPQVTGATHDILVVGVDYVADGLDYWVREWHKAAGDRPLIVVPFWELMNLPAYSGFNLDCMADGVWAASQFLGDVFKGSVSSAKLVKIPLPVTLDEGFKLRSDISNRFQVMYNWTANSSRVRKNPECLLAAWVTSGLAYVPDAVLVMVHDDETLGNQTQVAPWYKNVASIRKGLSEKEMRGLYMNCHLYVSPARSEGIGLGQIEALQHGCRLIIPKSTGIAGEMDIFSAVLPDIGPRVIQYKSGLTPVTCPQYQYYLGPQKTEAVWQDPDYKDLALQLAKMYQLWKKDPARFNPDRTIWECLRTAWTEFDWKGALNASSSAYVQRSGQVRLSVQS